MSFPIQYIRRRIAAKLIFMVGLTLFVIIFAWVHFNIAHQRQKLMEHILHTADRHTARERPVGRYAGVQCQRLEAP